MRKNASITAIGSLDGTGAGGEGDMEKTKVITDWSSRLMRALQRATEELLLDRVNLSPVFRLAFSVAVVMVAFFIREQLHPFLGADRFVFTVFYLAVVLVALVAGVMPALLASVIAAPLAYWAFATPEFGWDTKAGALFALCFYVLTASINILLIVILKQVLLQNRTQREAAEQMAHSHAAMFREFNLRSVHHLQLVAALLDARVQADVVSGGAGDLARYSRAVSDASHQTFAISRLHRAMGADSDAPIDITAFCRQMLLAGSDAIGPKTAISVSGDPMLLPTEQATSLSIALLEIVRAIAEQEPAILHFAVTSTSHDRCIDIHAEGDGGTALAMALDDVFSRQLVDASLTQIGATMAVAPRNGAAALRLILPVEGKMAGPLQPGWHRLLNAMPGEGDLRH